MTEQKRQRRKKKPARKRKAKASGRPEFAPTKEMRERVEILAGGGMPEQVIAHNLKIARMTLRKHFDVELTYGRASRQGDMLVAQYRAGAGGNVAAQKAYLAAGHLGPPTAPAPTPEQRPEKLGKKEQQAEAAQEPPQEGSEWAGLLN